MAEEFSVPVGQPESPSLFSGQRGRLLLLGGLGVAVAAVILIARRGGGGASSDAENVAPGALTPDAAIALGSLEQQVRERSGMLAQQVGALGDTVNGLGATVGGLGEQFSGFETDILSRVDNLDDTILGRLDASQRATIESLYGVQGALKAEIRGQALPAQLAAAPTPEAKRGVLYQYARALIEESGRRVSTLTPGGRCSDGGLGGAYPRDCPEVRARP